jgi:ubiquinol-cytochrome c reductase iron-sulfur subunit
LPSDVTRRGVFGQIWGIGLGAFALLAVVPFFALQRRTSTPGTAWKAGSRLVNPDGKPMRVDDLAIGGVETVFPEGAVDAPEAATLLIRLPENTADVDPARHDWVQQGNIAYSKICTHAGCPVAIYREQSLELYCPCHQSVFDVLGFRQARLRARNARAAAVGARHRRARLPDRARRLRGSRRAG